MGSFGKLQWDPPLPWLPWGDRQLIHWVCFLAFGTFHSFDLAASHVPLEGSSFWLWAIAGWSRTCSLPAGGTRWQKHRWRFHCWPWRNPVTRWVALAATLDLPNGALQTQSRFQTLELRMTAGGQQPWYRRNFLPIFDWWDPCRVPAAVSSFSLLASEVRNSTCPLYLPQGSGAALFTPDTVWNSIPRYLTRPGSWYRFHGFDPRKLMSV